MSSKVECTIKVASCEQHTCICLRSLWQKSLYSFQKWGKVPSQVQSKDCGSVQKSSCVLWALQRCGPSNLREHFLILAPSISLPHPPGIFHSNIWFSKETIKEVSPQSCKYMCMNTSNTTSTLPHGQGNNVKKTTQE